VIRPQSQTVYVGDDVTLRCTARQRIGPHWYFKPFSSSDNEPPLQIVVIGRLIRTFGDRYSVVRVDSHSDHLTDSIACNLFIPNVDSDVAGVYTCVEAVGDIDKESVKLTVVKRSAGNDCVTLIYRVQNWIFRGL